MFSFLMIHMYHVRYMLRYVFLPHHQHVRYMLRYVFLPHHQHVPTPKVFLEELEALL